MIKIFNSFPLVFGFASGGGDLTDNILLETGDALLLETGDQILLEA